MSKEVISKMEEGVSGDEMQTVARQMARRHAESEPGIQEIYLFPNGGEIRLIEIDSTTTPSPQVEPFYFGPDRVGGIPYPSAIALIRPEEKDKLPPPEGWGGWRDAQRIWPVE